MLLHQDDIAADSGVTIAVWGRRQQANYGLRHHVNRHAPGHRLADLPVSGLPRWHAAIVLFRQSRWAVFAIAVGLGVVLAHSGTLPVIEIATLLNVFTLTLFGLFLSLFVLLVIILAIAYSVDRDR